MLKIWKETREEEGSSRTVQPGHDSDPVHQSGGTSNSTPPSGVAEAVSPAYGDVIQVTDVPGSHVSPKRFREEAYELELTSDADFDHPTKKTKTEHLVVQDFLRNHLPEILDGSQAEAGPSYVPTADFEDQAIERAKKENSNVYLSFMNNTWGLITI